MNFDDFAPVKKAEAAAAAAAPEAPLAPAVIEVAVASAPVAVTPAPAAPVPLFVGRADRSRAFPLEYPIEFGGRVYDAITLRRPNARQVGEFFEEWTAALAADPDALVYFPVFVDEAGATIPAAVIDALDDDDRQPLFRAVADFLPLRLLLLRESGDLGSVPVDGANTAPTSSK